MNSITEIKNDILCEKYYRINHSSGLTVLIMPKEGYSSSYALFGTKYGSIDNVFRKKGEKEFTRVPEGIAHFLEHKLFESEDLDAFERYAKTGASANAFTSFDRTCYLFSCTDNFRQNLEILLDFVSSPYFTQQTVEKEQGIIGQEIRMYKDVPGWEVLFNLLRCLFHTHPVAIDIAGTEESIARIDADMLYKCYNTFYNLNNMVLAVAGNITKEEVLETCDKYLKKSESFEIERYFENEPANVVSDYMEEKLSVATPVFNLGFKETHGKPERSLKDEICADIILEAVAGNTSELYKQLIDEGLINTSFSCEYFTGYGYAVMIFGGESSNPGEVADRIKAKIKEFKKDGIGEENFKCALRKLYGRTIMAYNDIEYLADSLIKSEFMGETLFDDMDIYKSLTVKDVDDYLKNVLDEKYSALSVVNPV